MQFLMAMTLLAAEVDSRPVDFDTQVMPILTKAGCNSGSCHGAAAGRGEFHLSLYGSRPKDDFDEITRAFEGRRINHRDATQSLVLMKPTEQVSHEGGTRLDPDGTDFELLRRWISDGAKRQPGRKLREFSLVGDSSLTSVGDRMKLSATAVFSDGMKQDVLPWTVLTPDDPTAIEIDDHGVVTLKRVGRHIVVARYLNRVVPLEFLVSNSIPATRAQVFRQPQAIDDFVDDRLGQLGLKAAAPATDGQLLRRLSLDLRGRLPEPQEVEAFVTDQSVDKRAKRIDEFLESTAFDIFWTHHLAELLRVSDTKRDAQAAAAYYSWLRRCVSQDTSFRDVATQLLMAEGSVTEHGPANFYAVTGDARAQAEFLSHAFLGVRLQCANCHDHPLDAWTQDDYHGLAAIFAGVKRGPIIRITQSGEVIHPTTGEAAVAKIPGGDFIPNSEDQRAALADWLTSSQNPYFAKAVVNRIWNHLMGRGLVEPVDDLRVTNPPTHPALLDWLAQDFAAHGYQIRHTVRRICLSAAYARGTSSQSRGIVGQFYAVGNARPMSPVVFLDAVADVTGIGDAFSRAVSFAGITKESASLDLLGRCSAGECGASGGKGDDLPVQLHLLNGDLLNGRVANVKGRLMTAIVAGKSPLEIVDEFYVRAFSRHPTVNERDFWSKQFQDSDDRERLSEVAQDFLWSLLSSDEFRTNR